MDKKIIFPGQTHDGSIHDYTLLKNELAPDVAWFEKINVSVDLGYKGIKKEYSFSENINIPHKKPGKSKNNPNPSLTKKQKNENRTLSKHRVVVEHAIGGMKRFQSMVIRFRNHVDIIADQIACISAGLWNLKLSMNTMT